MWASEKVCLDTQEYFDLVCQAIAGARQSIVLEMYIFREDRLGSRLLESLRCAAKRGVSVRMVVDGVGSPRFTAEFLRQLGSDKITARIYHPTPNILQAIALPSSGRFRHFFSSINKRNHRKLIVVDQAVAFVGSCNVADMHSHWRETAVRVTGVGLRDLSRSFELIWSRSSHPDLPATKAIRARIKARRELRSSRIGGMAGLQGLVRVNYTRRLRVANNAELAAQIGRARHHVWITNAYFVPSPAILGALLKATRNGCDVKLLLPGKSDVNVVSYVSRMFYRPLILAGVEIYEYQPAVLHAKTLLVDDWACVGTSNLNHRSFYHDLEVDVALSEYASRRALIEQFKQDLGVSARIGIEQLRRRPFVERLGGYLAYPFRSFI